MAKDGRGGKLGHTCTVTLRMPPELKEFMDVAAHRDRRTLSNKVVTVLLDYQAAALEDDPDFMDGPVRRSV